jgi:hypothetical protein
MVSLWLLTSFMPNGIPLTVRLPQDLHAALVERASVDMRSLNSEIAVLLREALFPMVDADAYRHNRATLRDLPRHVVPQAMPPHRRRKI